ncbi:MAG: DeoR/GlpR family DNA-binding transcription regulator [Bacillota bacterium]|nr:DeoR/GlpR family DNA-binding transcription regulator [Bacillota bacterium]
MRTSDAKIRERRAKLIQILHNNPDTAIPELSQLLNVSQATIRRDIKFLENKDQISTSFSSTDSGIKMDILPEFDSDVLYHTNIKEKEKIAQSAAKMLKSGDVVFINSSSTALRVIKYIEQDFVTVITNNARSLLEPLNNKVKLILIGGEVIRNAASTNSKMCTTGDYAVSQIENVLANVCIIGVSGITEDRGLSTAVINELTINREMIKSCFGEVIVVADHRKIGVNHNYLFADISNVNYLITDNKSNPENIKKIEKEGVEVILVNAE